ncbi:SPOR domain-containing protein [Stutzerimonas balearica]|uniref:SPOR domain-containing protein n=1 Tax=Stutzerimonas balearica TaxID=74829 RepID=UPI003F76DC5C
MPMLDRGLKQRMVGALVLVALAVIFLPMLLSSKDERRPVEVDAPPMPAPTAQIDVAEPQPGSVPEGFEIVEDDALESSNGEAPAITAPGPATPPTASAEPTAPEAKPEPEPEPKRLDAANLPVSWSVQLASLSNRQSAEALQARLRAQGYNAYVRTVDGMNRVFVGPLIERDEANKLRDQLHRQQKLDGFVVRFKPEAG